MGSVRLKIGGFARAGCTTSQADDMLRLKSKLWNDVERQAVGPASAPLLLCPSICPVRHSLGSNSGQGRFSLIGYIDEYNALTQVGLGASMA